jgi:hypothetical protein
MRKWFCLFNGFFRTRLQLQAQSDVEALPQVLLAMPVRSLLMC